MGKAEDLDDFRFRFYFSGYFDMRVGSCQAIKARYSYCGLGNIVALSVHHNLFSGADNMVLEKIEVH